VYEQFGAQIVSDGRSIDAFSARVPVRPSGPIPSPDTIRTSTARPKPTNAAIPVARRTDTQVEVGEPLLVAAGRERLAVVATIRAVNAELADKVYIDGGSFVSPVGRHQDTRAKEDVTILYELPPEVSRWRPDGVAINAELTADELSGDFRDRSDRMVNVCVSGPTPFLKETRERVGTRVYLLLIREPMVRFVPRDAKGPGNDRTLIDREVVEWLSKSPRRPTDVVCADVKAIMGNRNAKTTKKWLKEAPNKRAWQASGGWWGVELAGFRYQFVLLTTPEISLEGAVPDVPGACCVVRAWHFGRIMDNNARLRGAQASTLHVCIGAPIFAHEAIGRHVGAPELGIYAESVGASVLDQIRA
jgi:hypothetical protein